MTEYFVRQQSSEETGPGQVLEVGVELITGEKDFAKHFGEPTSLERDLLTIGAAVFAADRGTIRAECENYQRSISVSVPVVNFAQLHPLLPRINRVLRKLSDDWWSVSLRMVGGVAEASKKWPSGDSVTLLFSGGLDSLAAAVEYGKSKAVLNLVSHRTKNPITDGAQRKLLQLLKENKFNVAHYQSFITSASSHQFDHDVEGSQRTRSFLFLILGALAARRLKSRKLLMLAENGQLAIHLPLTSARIGALSTHTAHPSVLTLMQEILATSLNFALELNNPYVYKTKAEVISPIMTDLAESLPLSTSCWKNVRLKKPATHCGACIPCYVRRIAIETYSVDPTAYERDVWAAAIGGLPEDDDGRRNVIDLAEFIRRFESLKSADIMAEFPELYSDDFDAAKVIEMYRRFAVEARSVLKKYPVAAIL